MCYSTAMAQMRFPAAIKICENVLKIMPRNLTVISDYALALMRAGQYRKSYKQYKKIYELPHENLHTNWLDGLAEVCGWLDKKEELQRYGLEALNRADEAYRNGKKYPLPTEAPPPFNKNDKSKNIISYSLYGANPRYCETLVKNAEICHELYPAWTCRVYLDESVPEHILSRLQRHNVQLIDMTGSELTPTMWRFLVMDDESVSRFIVRDADSLISEKEAAAVNAWVSSPYWFHHMRDYFTHTDLLLAGMWGGCQGVFKGMGDQMLSFMQTYTGTSRYTDQTFLKHELWPTVRESILNHDQLFNFHGANNFPEHPPVRWKKKFFHIGSNAGYTEIRKVAADKTAESQSVDLIIGEDVCHYKARVLQGEWILNIPFYLTDEIEAGTCKIIDR
ncbi:tetratricopeptide repeat protein [Buttiauxella sp. B2]|nr:tetratricopeptide repeat protein [Buttiauxella sp. B2]